MAQYQIKTHRGYVPGNLTAYLKRKYTVFGIGFWLVENFLDEDEDFIYDLVAHWIKKYGIAPEDVLEG